MAFSEAELEYLRSQPLGRLATVASDGQPDAVPVGFEYDGTYLYVGGIDPVRTRKYRNVQDGNTKVAFVIDDLASVRPWIPRYLRILNARASSARRTTCASRRPCRGASTWTGVPSRTTRRSPPPARCTRPRR